MTNLGQICNCARCGVKCQVTATEKSSAPYLRRNTKPKGMCANCAVSEWLANTYPANMLVEEGKHGPAVFLIPALREQFAELILQGTDLRPEEIDWQKVVDNWSLPMKVQAGPRNPHQPGDSVTRNLAMRQVRDESLFNSLTQYVEQKQGYPTMETSLSYIPENDASDGYIC